MVDQKSSKTIGKQAKYAKWHDQGNSDVAGAPSWAQAVLHGDPCNTNGKSTFLMGAACVAPWTMVTRVSTNMVDRIPL